MRSDVGAAESTVGISTFFCCNAHIRSCEANHKLFIFVAIERHVIVPAQYDQALYHLAVSDVGAKLWAC